MANRWTVTTAHLSTSCLRASPSGVSNNRYVPRSMSSSTLDARNSTAVGAAVEMGGDTPNWGTLLSTEDEDEAAEAEAEAVGAGDAADAEAESMRLQGGWGFISGETNAMRVRPRRNTRCTRGAANMGARTSERCRS